METITTKNIRKLAIIAHLDDDSYKQIITSKECDEILLHTITAIDGKIVMIDKDLDFLKLEKINGTKPSK